MKEVLKAIIKVFRSIWITTCIIVGGYTIGDTIYKWTHK